MGILIFDGTNPLDPQWIGTYPAFYWDMEIAGGYLYGTHSHELVVLSLSAPWQPQESSVCPTVGFVWDLCIENGRAYLADSYLEIIDVGDPHEPAWLGMFDNFRFGRPC
jgi:hypothetical protein